MLSRMGVPDSTLGTLVKRGLVAIEEVAEDFHLGGVGSQPDKSIAESILAGASCVVVIPKYKKGAFVFGAQYGQGVVTCRTAMAGARRSSSAWRAAPSASRLAVNPPISSWLQ